jgi:hypothetical protein
MLPAWPAWRSSARLAWWLVAVRELRQPHPLCPSPSGATMLPGYPTAMASGGHVEGGDAVSPVSA